MSFNISIKKLIEYYPQYSFLIIRELIPIKTLGIKTSEFEALAKAKDSKTLLSIISETEYIALVVPSIHILEKFSIHGFFVYYILKVHWKNSYSLREQFFNWVVQQIYFKMPKCSSSYYDYKEIQEFETQLLQRINSNVYSFIPDESIVFNLPHISYQASEQSMPNHIYWFSRYLKAYGKTANVGQFYTKCVNLIFGKTKTQASIMFEFEAKIYLATLL